MSHSVVPPFPRALRHRILSALVAASAIAAAPGSPLQPQTASIEIDAGKQRGSHQPAALWPLPLIHVRGNQGRFARRTDSQPQLRGSPNVIGISRYWDRYPDDRNDDYGIAFTGTGSGLSEPGVNGMVIGGHSLRVQLRPGVIARHGLYQSRIPITLRPRISRVPVDQGAWFEGDVRVALESDVTGGGSTTRRIWLVSVATGSNISSR